jgi:hypothetical protein
MITFRVGAFDAEILEKEFAPQFTAEDLVNLGFTQIYLKLMIDGVSSAPFSASTMPPIKEPEISFKQEVVDMSRAQFAMKRATVEQDVLDWHKDKGRVVKKEPIKVPVDTILVEEKKLEVKIPERVPEKKDPSREPVKSFDKPKYFKRENSAPVMPKLDEPTDDFVSLKDLKSKLPPSSSVNQVSGFKKAVNEKSLAELREVLKSFSKDKPKSVPPAVLENKLKEIPEDKLRKMLQVDNNKLND